MSHRPALGARPTHFWTLLGLVVASLFAQGCGPQIPHPAPPSPVLIPTIVGIVDHESADFSAIVLTDGRSVPYRVSEGIKLFGAGAASGNLLVASMGSPKFVYVLKPLASENGCWNAWPAQTDQPMIWDMGRSILLGDGLELPKAAHFTAGAGTQTIDGRQVWINDSQATTLYRVCVDSSGQIEWLKLV